MWLLSCLTTCQLPKMAWHLSGSLCKRGAQQAAFRQGQKKGKTQCWITMRRSLKGEINASWFCSHYNHAWDLHLGFHCRICFPNEIQSFRKLSKGSWSGPPPSWGGGSLCLAPLDPESSLPPTSHQAAAPSPWLQDINVIMVIKKTESSQLHCFSKSRRKWKSSCTSS